MKITPCIIGLGYVGLPIALEISKKYETFGFDINKKRIATLKKNQCHILLKAILRIQLVGVPQNTYEKS